MNSSVDVAPHYVWYDIESIFWYLYIACLRVDRRQEYANVCQVSMEHASGRKLDLYADVPSSVQRYRDSRIHQSWQLLDAFAKFLELHEKPALHGY